MDNLKYLTQFECCMSLGLCAASSLAGYCFFQADWKTILGFWIGTFAGLLGFFTVILMVKSINPNSNSSERFGTFNYVARYAMYGIIFGIAAWNKIPVLAMLLGFVFTKASLILYSLKTRKEYESGSD